jgi:hypothetical protein
VVNLSVPDVKITVEAATQQRVVIVMTLVSLMVIAVTIIKKNVSFLIVAVTDVSISVENTTPMKDVTVMIHVLIMVIAVPTTKLNAEVTAKVVKIAVVDKLTKDVGVIPPVRIMVIVVTTTKKNV